MIWLRLLLKGSNKNTFDNNYFNDSCPGIPIWRYTQIIEKMLGLLNLNLILLIKSFLLRRLMNIMIIVMVN